MEAGEQVFYVADFKFAVQGAWIAELAKKIQV
jgi:hypothetical protein